MTIDFSSLSIFFLHWKNRKTKKYTQVVFIRIDIANIGRSIKNQGIQKKNKKQKTNNCVPRKSVRLVGCCGLITLIDVMNDVSIRFYPLNSVYMYLDRSNYGSNHSSSLWLFTSAALTRFRSWCRVGGLLFRDKSENNIRLMKRFSMADPSGLVTATDSAGLNTYSLLY